MMKRLFLSLISLISIISLLYVPCHAEQKGNAVYDYAEYFTPSEEILIENAAKEYFADNGCSVYIVTSPYRSTSYRGDDFRNANPDIDSNAVILILACNSADNYDMYTYGKCDRLISNTEVNEILDHPEVYDNIKYYDEYLTAVLEFIRLSSVASEPQIAAAITVGVIIGLAVSISVFVCVLISYNKKQRSEKYPLDRYARLDIKVARDDYMGSFVTKRVISTGSSRGGGGRSGGFGGGGGHRGGR